MQRLKQWLKPPIVMLVLGLTVGLVGGYVVGLASPRRAIVLSDGPEQATGQWRCIYTAVPTETPPTRDPR